MFVLLRLPPTCNLVKSEWVQVAYCPAQVYWSFIRHKGMAQEIGKAMYRDVMLTWIWLTFWMVMAISYWQCALDGLVCYNPRHLHAWSVLSHSDSTTQEIQDLDWVSGGIYLKILLLQLTLVCFCLVVDNFLNSRRKTNYIMCALPSFTMPMNTRDSTRDIWGPH